MKSKDIKDIYDVIIIGAGAAGLICAMEAGKNGKSVLLLDHMSKPAEKIRISGGGRCNFTNIHTSPDNFLSKNPHFCKSALKQYTQYDFIDLIESHDIAYHEKTLGQLFCDGSATQIIDMFLRECKNAGVTILLETKIEKISKDDDLFNVDNYQAKSLVIASGGLSIPKIGASAFSYNIAKQFDLDIIPTYAGLVPLTFSDELLEYCKSLAGVSVPAIVSFGKRQFTEGLLFTHKGLSGPSILQISSYWREGENININLAPESNVFEVLKQAKISNPKQNIHKLLAKFLPARLAEKICENVSAYGKVAEITDKKLQKIHDKVHNWQVIPNGTEGYRTAEVTCGGVNTDELSSKTMECKKVQGLYFIGEALDVTGHLGGFNFQWAWSSGFVAGQNV